MLRLLLLTLCWQLTLGELLFVTDKFTVEEEEGDGISWTIYKSNGKFALRGYQNAEAESFSVPCSGASDTFCRRDAYGRRTTASVRQSCVHFATEADSVDDVLVDCLDLGEAHWFGGPEQYNQNWPIEHQYFNESSYVAKAEDAMAIVERYWLNSLGVYVHLPQQVPLFIDQNHRRNNSLCFVAKNAAPFQPRDPLILEYSVCGLDASDARVAHMDAVERFLGKPEGIPDTRMIKHPIWSTWARYKTNISQERVLEFADEILANGFNNSALEVDDFWETCYGSLEFDLEKFPHPRQMTLDLHARGFRVTLWVHPFINTDCEPYFTEAVDSGYLIANDNGSVVGYWWNGESGNIDFTKPDAEEWWTRKVRRLVSFQLIDSFKFDGGEASWAPQIPVLNAPNEDQPGILTERYVEACAAFGPLVEVRVASRTQRWPIFTRMADKSSRWGRNNGLGSVITTMLQMNMVGYPFVLPDMIGGNGYEELPTKELFIRWMQVNTFMPAVQFSYVPWDFDQETVEICRRYAELHASLASEITQLAALSVLTGAPINPPIWWISPDDEVAQSIDDEFLLGTQTLVAPVVQENATSRDIYLPSGIWLDQVNQELVFGPIWLLNFKAPLDTLPYFTLLPASEVATGIFRQHHLLV